MNLYDHFFEFNIPDNRQTVIPIVIPFKKQGIEKDEKFTSSLIKYQTCTNKFQHFYDKLLFKRI